MSENRLIPLGPRGLQLSTFDELLRFSRFVVDAGLAPKSVDTEQKVFLALQKGLEVGLPPMACIQNVAVINNRVAFYGDICEALVQASGLIEDTKVVWSGTEGKEDFTVTVSLKRKGQETPRIGRWSLTDTRIAGLGGVHKGYPRQMMFWRAWHQAAKIFSDVLQGVIPREIEEENALGGFGFDQAKAAQGRVLPTPLPTKESLQSATQKLYATAAAQQVSDLAAQSLSTPNNEAKDKEAPVDSTKAETQPPESKEPPAPIKQADPPQGSMAATNEYLKEGLSDPKEDGYWYWVRKRLVELEVSEAIFIRYLVGIGLAHHKVKKLEAVPEEVLKRVIQGWDSVVDALKEQAQSV